MKKRIEPTLVEKAIETVQGFDLVCKNLVNRLPFGVKAEAPWRTISGGLPLYPFISHVFPNVYRVSISGVIL